MGSEAITFKTSLINCHHHCCCLIVWCCTQIWTSVGLIYILLRIKLHQIGSRRVSAINIKPSCLLLINRNLTLTLACQQHHVSMANRNIFGQSESLHITSIKGHPLSHHGPIQCRVLQQRRWASAFVPLTRYLGYQRVQKITSSKSKNYQNQSPFHNAPQK